MRNDRHESRIRAALGTTEPITGGCFVQRQGEGDSALGLLAGSAPCDTLIAAAVTAAGAAVLVRRLFRRARKVDHRRDAAADRAPSPLPNAVLALALVGDEVLIGRRGAVLRRLPADDVLRTVRRPKLNAEVMIEGDLFEAPGIEGDRLYRLRRSAA